MKKITFIAESIYPFNKGGAEKRVFDYATILASNLDNNVRVISKKWWLNEEVNDKDKIQYEGICKKSKMYKKNGKRNILSSMQFGIATFFYVLKSDDDVLDIDIFPYFPLILAKFATFFKKKRPIINCYWLEYWGKNYWKKYYKRLWFLGVWLEQMSFWACDKIVADSNFTKKQLEKVFNKEHKQIIFIPPTSIDMNRIDKIPINKKIYDIIYYGRIIEHKHVEYVVSLVASLTNDNKNTRALIIGNGSNQKKIKEKIVYASLSENIDMIDFVDSYDDLMRCVKSAKIMVQPSEREGFGITVVEANAAGLPVLVMDFPDNAAKELIKDNVNGFVCGNEKQLYNQSKKILYNSEMLKKMSNNSRKAAQNYNDNVMSKKIMSYYKGL